MVYTSVQTARDVSIAALASGQTAASAAAKPMLMTDGEHLQWLVAFFSQAARDGLEGRPSPFVHHRIAQLKLSTFQHAPDTLWEGQVECSNLGERVSGIHSLITQSLNRLLLDKPSNKKDPEVENLVTRMFTAARSLWQEAPTNLDEVFGPWEAWLVAESIRRSMFAAIFIRGFWHAAANGYIFYEPFFESLPFDPRAGLWEAESSGEWQELISKYGGEHTKLKSYHEFITTTGSKLDAEENGAFQRMLFVCYNGLGGIRALQELDKRISG